MPCTLHVRLHPLGVVVSHGANGRGELLIRGEACCGVSFEQLERIALTTRKVDVDEAAAKDCLLRQEQCPCLTRSQRVATTQR
jgi:hypothetical protein